MVRCLNLVRSTGEGDLHLQGVVTLCRLLVGCLHDHCPVPLLGVHQTLYPSQELARGDAGFREHLSHLKERDGGDDIAKELD